MSTDSHGSHAADDLAGRVLEATGESTALCYQCGKCSAGCPLADEMDYPPNQILRMMQIGIPDLEEKALRSLSIWLCLTCETCVTRCPKEVDLPKIMDHLRQESLRRNLAHPMAKDILAFHQAFLDAVRKNGRLYEVGLISSYKMKTGHLFQDLTVAPKLYMRGKLHPFPHKIQGQAKVAELFERTKKKENQG